MKAISNSGYLLLLFVLGFSACKPQEDLADAYGNFEAREVIISSEVTGRLLQFSAEEGQTLDAGQLVALIDTVPFHLRREQLRASMSALRQKTQDARPQIAVLEEQRRNLVHEQKRVEALLASNAATTKQLDDLKGQIDVIDRQIAAASSQEGIANRGILAELAPLEAQLRQVDDQVKRCYLYNPISGTVLLKMAEPSEMAIAGKALYKIADLSTMTLRAYVSGDQLAQVQLGKEVKVYIDKDKETNTSIPGKVTWVSDQAEFTPKIVQTKEERVNLVYAVKIEVKNYGALKIGMPGEVRF